MAILERTYNVPLRRQWLKVQRHYRAKKAVRGLREFLVRHMKSENIKIGPYLNEFVWANSMKNPPHHVKVQVRKHDDGLVLAELEGKQMFTPKKKEEKKEKSKIEEKIEQMVGKPKRTAPKKEDSKEKTADSQKSEPKHAPKEETKKVARVTKESNLPHTPESNKQGPTLADEHTHHHGSTNK